MRHLLPPPLEKGRSARSCAPGGDQFSRRTFDPHPPRPANGRARRPPLFKVLFKGRWRVWHLICDDVSAHRMDSFTIAPTHPLRGDQECGCSSRSSLWRPHSSFPANPAPSCSTPLPRSASWCRSRPAAPTDVVARILADLLSAHWSGKSVVVENRPGAGTIVATAA